MLLRSSGVRRVLVGSVSSLALAFWAHIAAANPMDGVVEAGSAEISSPNTGTLVINQTSDKAIINWGSFDVGLGERTQFVLPGSTSVTLNRDFSGNPSEILGSVTSNGRFYLVNPNGILFGRDARVDVAGLVATTYDIRSGDFLGDHLDFSIAGEPGASVINQGHIRVDDLGFGAFVAPHVRNDGAIVAHMGKVELASASGFTLDLRGDSLISFLVENPNQYGILDANGQPVSALVENTGSITADGGQVVLRAAAARGVVDSVINTDGIIQANTVEQRGGKIVLGGGGAGSVKVKGKVSARGNKAGEKGGEIIVTGTLLTAEQTAMLDASGWAGGGKILFGGDYLGGTASNDDVAKFRFTMEDEAIQTSAGVLLEEGAQLKADALVDGNGGKVVVWSDKLTSTAADISARGGSSAGDGGFIETSSAGVLDVRAAADTSASNGQSGTWLLDPLNITIDDPASANSRWRLTADELFNFFPAGVFLADVFRPTSTGSVISSAIIEDALNAGSNVVVTTRDTVGSAEGNIRVSTGITKTSGGDARLSVIAANDVIIDPGVAVLSFSGELDVELNAETGSIIGTNLGDSFLAGGALLMLARDGIQFSTSSVMPENFYLVVNNVSAAFNQVNIAFGLDRIRFGYNSSNLELGTGAITLIEDMATGNASYIGFARPVNVHLSDRAIVGTTDPMSFPRVWNINNTRSWSAVNRNALNGIPEIEGFSGVSLSFGAEPGSGYTAVVEVSDQRDGTTDSWIVTAPSGDGALNNYLLGNPPVPGYDPMLQQAQYPNIGNSATQGPNKPPVLSCQLPGSQCQNLRPELPLKTLDAIDGLIRDFKAGKNIQGLYGYSKSIYDFLKYSSDIKDMEAIIEVAKAFGMSGEELTQFAKAIDVSKAGANIAFIAVDLLGEYAIERYWPDDAIVSESMARLVFKMSLGAVKGSVAGPQGVATGVAVEAAILVTSEYAELAQSNNNLVRSILDGARTNLKMLESSPRSIDVFNDTLALYAQISADLGNKSIWPTQTSASWKIYIINEMLRLRASQIAPGSISSASMQGVRELAQSYDSAGIVRGTVYARFADEVAATLGVTGWVRAYVSPDPMFTTANSTQPMFP